MLMAVLLWPQKRSKESHCVCCPRTESCGYVEAGWHGRG